jgi:flagellar biosynthesis regulator FlaF
MEKISVQVKSRIQDGVINVDADHEEDLFQVRINAKDIFAYYERREGRLTIQKCLENQPQLNKNMRAIFVKIGWWKFNKASSLLIMKRCT